MGLLSRYYHAVLLLGYHTISHTAWCDASLLQMHGLLTAYLPAIRAFPQIASATPQKSKEKVRSTPLTPIKLHDGYGEMGV